VHRRRHTGGGRIYVSNRFLFTALGTAIAEAIELVVLTAAGAYLFSKLQV